MDPAAGCGRIQRLGNTGYYLVYGGGWRYPPWQSITGETNPEQVRSMSGEDKVPGEDVVYYDISFFIYRPDKKDKM